MRKISILLTLLFFCVLSTFVHGQEIIESYSDTVSNSQAETFYIKVNSDAGQKLDSIALQAIYTGEIDFDRVIVTKGVFNDNTFVAVASPDTTALSVDNADGTTTAAVYSASSTGLNDLPGYDFIKVSFEAASTGNDASDPNNLKVKAFKYYTSMR